MTRPAVRFGTPRKLPKAGSLAGRVVVLDVAFAADAMGSPFEKVTGKFLADLGERLALWVDHHDHDLHERYRADPRFVLATKQEHGACPEMVTPELVRRAGAVDTILCHTDLDGLYAAAKWLLGGKEPYPGADDDARAVDTRIGEPSKTGKLIDRALRAKFKDDALKHAIVEYLVGGMRDTVLWNQISDAAAEFEALEIEARRLARMYELRGRVAFVDAQYKKGGYDKTLLLMLGQDKAPVAIVLDGDQIALAARYDSGIDFLRELRIEGGMPTRITLSASRLDEVLALLNARH